MEFFEVYQEYLSRFERRIADFIVEVLFTSLINVLHTDIISDTAGVQPKGFLCGMPRYFARRGCIWRPQIFCGETIGGMYKVRVECHSFLTAFFDD